MTFSDKANPSSGIQVIARAGQILRALSNEPAGLSLSELSLRVSLPRSTVHRIVVALDAEGLATSVSPSGRYKLGPELLRLATGQYRDLRSVMRPMLLQLSAEVDETVDLSVPMGDHVSFIDQVAAPHRLRAVSAVGGSFLAHCSANGKALLATYGDDMVRKLVPDALAASTPNSITAREDLIAELASIRMNGFALDREENTLGISAVGAAVHDAFGPVAAVSIPVPTQRFSGNEQFLAAALIAACARMSGLLGGPVS